MPPNVPVLAETVAAEKVNVASSVPMLPMIAAVAAVAVNAPAIRPPAAVGVIVPIAVVVTMVVILVLVIVVIIMIVKQLRNAED